MRSNPLFPFLLHCLLLCHSLTLLQSLWFPFFFFFKCQAYLCLRAFELHSFPTAQDFLPSDICMSCSNTSFRYCPPHKIAILSLSILLLCFHPSVPLFPAIPLFVCLVIVPLHWEASARSVGTLSLFFTVVCMVSGTAPGI